MTETLHQQVRLSVFTFTLLDCSAAGSLLKLNQIGQRNVTELGNIPRMQLLTWQVFFFFFFTYGKNGHDYNCQEFPSKATFRLTSVLHERTQKYFSEATKFNAISCNSHLWCHATWCHNGTTALFRNATIILPQSCDHRWTSLGAGVNTPKMHLGQLWSVRPHPEAVTFLQQCVQACVLDNINGPPTQLTSSVLWKKELVSVVPVMDGFMANKAGSDITCLCDVVSMFV